MAETKRGPRCDDKRKQRFGWGQEIASACGYILWKGVILAEPYKKMNAELFSHFVRRCFPTLFQIAGHQDSQCKVFT